MKFKSNGTKAKRHLRTDPENTGAKKNFGFPWGFCMDFLGNQTRMNFPGNRMGMDFLGNQTGVAKK